MKSLFSFSHIKTLAIACLSAVCLRVGAASADTTYVYLRNGGVDVFPGEVARVGALTTDGLAVTCGDGSVITYSAGDVERVGHDAPSDLPQLTLFKINNKYNDQVFVDVTGTIAEGRVDLEVGCIGKWLTPSFQVSDERATVYVGNTPQQSKVSRRSFDGDVTYTVALDGMRVMRRRQLTEDIWSTGTETIIPLALTIDQLSTNAPSNYDEGLDKMLDGNPSTFFHSTWGSGIYQKLPDDSCPHIDIHLKEPLSLMRWTMTTRGDNNRMPTAIELLASDNGRRWEHVAVYTTSSGLPTRPGATFVSPVVSLGGDKSYVRLKMLSASYKNYFCVAELSIDKVIASDEQPHVIVPATYTYEMEPYGKDYAVHVNWLADKADNVPVIHINTAGNQMISSKDYYLDAEISIDGAGVFPSMNTTPMHIKGRGNTTWSDNPWNKNPYRLKFDEKVKPLGMTGGKNWVLLANSQRGAMMANAVGMKAACLAATAFPHHLVPVELYINGQYRGNYNLTEKTGLANNSIDLEDESYAVLLELDTNYDETYKFKSNPYNLPVNIKEPDFSQDETRLTLSDIVTDFNRLMTQLKKGGEIADLVDIDYLARYLMVSDLIENYELMHPKSTFLYKENVKGPDKYVFGPLWDFDWAYGYEQNRTYFLGEQETDYYTKVWMEARDFVHDLRYVSRQLDRAYYKTWALFMTYSIDELLDYCGDYYRYARPSLENNYTKWGDGNNYDAVSQNARKWLRQRADYVFGHLTPYDLTDEELTPPTEVMTVTLEDFGEASMPSLVDVYNIQGQCVKRHVTVDELRSGLPAGIYIVGGKKMVIR